MGSALLLSGCSSTIPKHLLTDPVITPITAQNATLRTLPPPTERIVVAVYDFPDLTGQYSETVSGNQSISHAVTQGGSSLLIKALQDAGDRRWFIVLDRARLDDTLKERQIVTEMRRIYRNETKIPADVLPPLAHAGIILQGGITGYDTYTKTGGMGARYLGIGADQKWQQDTVTISLRAISTNTAEVLASVTTQKTVASVATQGGIFRYVAMDRVLEAEAGQTQNEPKQIAVQQAIEKAVNALIIEGAELGIWKFADRAAGRALIEEYRREKYGAALPLAAEAAVPPATSNAAEVVPTKPLQAKRPRSTKPAPAPDPGPAAPPPADAGEVLG